MSRVWVKSVAPNNLHGFRVNQLVLSDLTEGLNIVFASNASGKSTLAKAIVNLFQPEALDAEATINGVVWTGEEFVSLARRRREAKFGGFPGKTKDYYLDLQSLLQGLGQDAHVQELLAKGFKFAEAAKLTPIDRGKDVKDTRQLLQDLKEVRRRKQALLGEEQKLPDLARLVTEAEEAQSKVEALELALEQIEIHRQRSELERSLREIIEKLPGIEAQTSARQGELDQSIRNLKRLRGEEGALQEELLRIGVEFAPERGLSETDRLRIEVLIDELKKARVLRERIEADLAATNAALIQERARILRLTPDQDMDQLPGITDDQFRAVVYVADLADEARERKARGEGLKAALADWGEGGDYRSEDLERVQGKLIDWLEYEPPITSRPFLPALAVGLAAVGLALAIGSTPIRVVVALIGLGIAGLIYSKTHVPIPERPGLTGLPPEFQPLERTHQAVAEALLRVSKVKSDQEIASRLRLLAQSVESTATDWQSQLGGLDLKVDDPYRLRLVVEAASQYLSGCRTLSKLEQDLDECSERESQLSEELGDLYAAYRFPVAADRELESKQVFLSWFQVSADVESKGKEIEEEVQVLQGFLDHQGVPADSALLRRIESFKSRIGEAERAHRLKKALGEAESKLNARSFNLDRLSKAMGREERCAIAEMCVEEVQSEIERQRALAGELESRRKRHQDLLLEIRQAEESGTIEQHERSYRAGLARVEGRWETGCRDSVRYRISEVIRERLMTEDLPPVLETANDHLYRFSVGRYRLEFAKSPDDALGVISVNDLLDGKTQSYARLSTGTRVHVLLALRLALIEEQEKLTSGGQMKFPVLVDEAMAVSDPESSRAVAEALIHISSSRQVIMFTSQERDVSLVKSLLSGVAIHGLNQTPNVPEHVDSGLERTLLAPLSHRFDPRFPIGAHSAASIFGPSAPGGGQRLDQIGLDTRTLSAVSGLERARRELVHRYPRLNWTSCSDQKWAQTAFASRLQEFLDECCGCPHRFLEALQIHRGQAFNRNQLESAHDWLEGEGYLVEAVELDSLSELVVRNLENQDRDVWESAIKMFGEAFIPRFDTATWYLPSSVSFDRDAKPLARRSRRQIGGGSEGGLFDDFFTS